MSEPAESPRPARPVPKRAPLPQWWWDLTLRARRSIAAGLVLAVLGGVAVLAWPGSGASDGAGASTLPDVETARLLVDALPAQRVAVWEAIAECESEGEWGLATGNGFYGGLQFTQATWLEFGGVGSPHEASREQQIVIAEKVLDTQGWRAWPVCSRRLGLPR